MLQKLFVSNYAIINQVEVEFSDGLNVITGETGAGKSILLGALSLILGERAQQGFLLNQSQKSIVEGSFLLRNYDVKGYFTDNDLDYEDLTIIRRERSPSGKSRAFINDTPVTLDILRGLTSQLVDLHRQHESLSISSTAFQRHLVDSFAGINNEVGLYKTDYEAYQKLAAELSQLKAEEAKQLNDLDYWQFQVNELTELNPQSGEVEEISATAKLLSKAEEIKSQLLSITAMDDGNVLAKIQGMQSQLSKLAGHTSDLAELSDRLHSVSIELDDILQQLSVFENDLIVDEEKLFSLNQRSDELNRLLSKHQLNSADELIERQKALQTNIDKAGSQREVIEIKETELAEKENKLKKAADSISLKRTKALPTLCAEIKTVLAKVGMANAVIAFEHEKIELNNYGCDALEILFSGNTGSKPQSIKQVASGGEMSRLMLAIKAVIAGKTVLPTMIFDEIDSGISGEVAMRVGTVLHELSQSHQIITITHLPQIAGRGQKHISIFKEEVDGKSHSNIRELNREQRIVAIAEMLSGSDPSDVSLKTARELLSASLSS